MQVQLDIMGAFKICAKRTDTDFRCGEENSGKRKGKPRSYSKLWESRMESFLTLQRDIQFLDFAVEG